MNALKNFCIRLKRCEDGATLVEYGIALGLAITLGVGALAALGNDVSGTMTDAGSLMPSKTAPATTDPA